MKIQFSLFLMLLVFSVRSYAAIPEVNLSFVFAVPPNIIEENQYRQIAQRETQILNQYFITQDRQPIFKFKLKNYIGHTQFNKMNCKLSQRLIARLPISGDDAKKEFKQCFKHANSVYVFVYDAYNAEIGFKDGTSWGFNNNNQPFILLDWERLNYRNQAALPHEMGHVFGLRHICIPKAKRRDSTNLMASAGNCDGSGGKRDIGFNDDQLKIINSKFNQWQQAIKQS
jgi:hypothetical protein